MINNNRSVENAWKMMQNLYDELRSRKFKDIDLTSIDTLDKLYATIICKWCASLAKEGLYKEYVEITGEEMTSPRGQIDLQETISKQTKIRGAIICNYDELSGDILINHVLKGTQQYLLDRTDIDKLQREEIQKSLQLFNGIGSIDITQLRWNDIRFNNSNIRYKHLIEVCKTLLDEHLYKKSIDLNDDKRLYLLFKKQAYDWFNHHYGEEDEVGVFEQPFTLDNESPLEITINKVQKMVYISTEHFSLVICVRLQDEQFLDDSSLCRKHKEELVRYLREFKSKSKTKTAGCIVYVNTNKDKLNLQPITLNSFNDFMIGETTIDIHDQWRFTETKLKDIYSYFIEREKSKKMKVNNRTNSINK